jgi:hypothetical protein
VGSQTSTEQRNDLSYLDELLGELDDVDTGSTGITAGKVEELRGRVEIPMDEIEISLGIDPRRSPASLTSTLTSTLTPIIDLRGRELLVSVHHPDGGEVVVRP